MLYNYALLVITVLYKKYNKLCAIFLFSISVFCNIADNPVGCKRNKLLMCCQVTFKCYSVKQLSNLLCFVRVVFLCMVPEQPWYRWMTSPWNPFTRPHLDRLNCCSMESTSINMGDILSSNWTNDGRQTFLTITHHGSTIQIRKKSNWDDKVLQWQQVWGPWGDSLHWNTRENDFDSSNHL